MDKEAAGFLYTVIGVRHVQDNNTPSITFLGVLYPHLINHFWCIKVQGDSRSPSKNGGV